LAVFDLDGTITRHDTLLPFLWGYLWRRPWRWLRLLLVVPGIARFLFNRDRGALKGALIRAVLGGAEHAAIERWATRFVTGLVRDRLHPAALAAIAAHRDRGDRLLLMSASTDLYVPLIGRALGFDEVICSEVRWREDGRLDGRLSSANCRGEEKRRCLAAVIAREAPGRVCAYGDSRSDLAHMQLAHEGYLINVSGRLAAAAARHVQPLRWRSRA
jgi:HAD superfamily hydrolase (TIGR01490 family)